MGEFVNTVNTFTPDALIGGTEIPLLTKVVTIGAGAGNLARGTVLGKITASGKFKTADKDNADGSQTAEYILAYAADATSADVNAVVYTQGMFNREKLIVGATDTIADHEARLRDINIILTGVK
jgi:hypothetical protein